MKLTDSEEKELHKYEQYLNKLIPMGEKYARYKFLKYKQFHNCCCNPKCTGFEGTDDCIYCPKCASRLYKLKGINDDENN